jgi:hypothetical protein
MTTTATKPPAYRPRLRAGQIRTEAVGVLALVAKEGTGLGDHAALGRKLQVESA